MHILLTSLKTWYNVNDKLSPISIFLAFFVHRHIELQLDACSKAMTVRRRFKSYPVSATQSYLLVFLKLYKEPYNFFFFKDIFL